jgi:nucleophosmin 1
LSLRTVSFRAGAKDELLKQSQGVWKWGIKVTDNFKNVCIANGFLEGFEIILPVDLRLKCGSGPTHISG